MATWQFDLHLLPEQALDARYGSIPLAISDSEFETGEWWKGIAIPTDLTEQFSKLLPQGRSWSSSIQTWGEEDGNRIDVVWEDDEVVDILFRIDVRSLSYDLLSRLLRLARANHWVLWARSRRVLKPSLDQLLRAIQNSDSFRFVQDPQGLLDSLVPEGEPSDR